MILAIVRLNAHFVAAVRICVCLNISMFRLREPFNAPKMKMVQVRVVSHSLHRCIKPDMIATVKSAELVTKKIKLHFADAEADIGTMLALPIVLIHFDEEICGVIIHRKRVVFVIVHTNNVAIPGDTATREMLVELNLSLQRMSPESIEATLAQVARPCDA